jgi:hypothetical protein
VKSGFPFFEYLEISNTMEEAVFQDYLVINTDRSTFRNGKRDAVSGVGVYFGKNDKR